MYELIKDFVWGKMHGRRNRPWVPEVQAELPIAQGGLSVPCIWTELTTLAAMTAGKWAATACARELLLGDFLWGDNDTRTTYITPTWGGEVSPTVRDKLWTTGAAAVGAVVAERARGGDAVTASRRAQRFLTKNKGIYHEDGSYMVDAAEAMDDATRNEMLADKARLGRVDPNWLAHASLVNTSWLLDRHSNKYKLNGASFAAGKTTLSDVVSWTWNARGKVTFTPKDSIASKIMALRRHFGRFCFAVAYNFPALLYRPSPTDALVAYSAEAHQYHDWTLDGSEQELTTYDTSIQRDKTRVHSMAECDRAARTLGSAVHFGAHPALTRIVQNWAGDRRWRPRRGTLKKLAARDRHREGVKQRDKRVEKDDHLVVTRGMDFVEWVELRRIRATFLKLRRRCSDSRATGSRSGTGQRRTCRARILNAPAARARQPVMCFEWPSIGEPDEENISFCVFAFELFEVPSRAWEAVQETLKEHERTPEAREELPEAVNELWHFAVATTLHGTWTERLRRMEDPTMADEAHIALAISIRRRAITRFRTLNYQPDGSEEGPTQARARSALADVLLRQVEPPPMQALQPERPTNDLYLLFFGGGSRGNPGPGGSGTVATRVHVLTHAAQVVWVASMTHGSKKTANNTAEYKGLVNGLRQAKVSNCAPLYVVGDCEMVLLHLRMRRTPRKPHLAALYRKARALSDDSKVVSWAHHYREFNKMADFAANLTMDTRASVQVHAPTDRPIIQQLQEHADRGVNHWLETAFDVEGTERAGLMTTTRERAISMRQAERRRAAVQNAR